MAAGRTTVRNRWGWLGLVCAIAGCNGGDDDDALGGGAGGEAGTPAVGSGASGDSAAAGNAAASGHASGGDAGKNDAGGTGGKSAAGAGGDLSVGGAGSSGEDGQGGSESCAGEVYALNSFSGDTDALCVVAEHMWERCCPRAGDIATSLQARCAPDGSYCVVASFCTTFSPETGRDAYECGWHDCGGESSANDGGAGGSDNRCPADKLAEAWELAEEGLGVEPCANDSDCAAPDVCNSRIANRMFCGEPDAEDGR